MKSGFTHSLWQVALTSIVTIAVCVGCSPSRSAGSSAQLTDNPTTNQSSSATVNSSAQEKAVCSLSMSQLSAIGGLKLGMSRDEMLALFPGSKDDPAMQADLGRPPSPFGLTSFVIRPAKYESKEKFAGVSQITFTLLDGRVSNFTLGYNGPAWPHVDKFVEKFVEGTNLPAVDQWEAFSGLEHQMKTLTCAGFTIRIFAGGEGGNLNYVLIQDVEADKKLKDRRKKAREQASPTPGQ